MPQRLTVQIQGRTYDVELDGAATRVNGEPVALDSVSLDERCGLVFRVDGRAMRAVFDHEARESFVLFRGREFRVEFETERDRLLKRFAGVGHESHHHAEIRASMPGLVVRVATEVGAEVVKGQAVVILEAMKMENEIRAPADGVVKEVRARKGQAIEKGDLLVVLD